MQTYAEGDGFCLRAPNSMHKFQILTALAVQCVVLSWHGPFHDGIPAYPFDDSEIVRNTVGEWLSFYTFRVTSARPSSVYDTLKQDAQPNVNEINIIFSGIKQQKTTVPATTAVA